MSEEETREANSGAADLEQIRQILFGAFANEVQNRFQQLDQKMSGEFATVVSELNRLQQSMDERLESTSNRIKHEVAMLHESIAACREDGEQKRSEIHDRISATKHELQQQVSSLGNTLAATEHSLRHDMGKNLGELKEEIREQLNDVNQRIQAELSRLGEATVTRTSFRDALRALSSQFDHDQQSG